MTTKTRIVHGANEDFFQCSGRTVGSLKRSLREVFNIPTDAIGFVDGLTVDDTYLLSGDETLEFVREWGEKGLGELFTREELMDRLRIGDQDYRLLLSIGLPTLDLPVGVRHSEKEVDQFFTNRANDSWATMAANIQRIANKLDPPPSDKVDSVYIAEKLSCTTTWVADMTRNGEIPKSCIVQGTGNGKPWKFHRSLIDRWISSR